jgi:hypothetical protein
VYIFSSCHWDWWVLLRLICQEQYHRSTVCEASHSWANTFICKLIAFFPVLACVLGCTCRDKPFWWGQLSHVLVTNGAVVQWTQGYDHLFRVFFTNVKISTNRPTSTSRKIGNQPLFTEGTEGLQAKALTDRRDGDSQNRRGRGHGPEVSCWSSTGGRRVSDGTC